MLFLLISGLKVGFYGSLPMGRVCWRLVWLKGKLPLVDWLVIEAGPKAVSSDIVEVWFECMRSWLCSRLC